MKQAKVATVLDKFKVVLNVGLEDGVKVDMDFILFREGEEVLDPDTGISLGTFEEVIGRGVVTHAQARICTLESSSVQEGGRKVIRKSSPHNIYSFSGIFRPDTEEVFENPDTPKPFNGAKVGDFAKPL